MDSISFLINVEPEEIRLAEIARGQLQDLDIEWGSSSLGAIYQAKVINLLPGMDAAFVDIGQVRNALLYSGDIGSAGQSHSTIDQLLAPGQTLTVQVVRTPTGNKGARVSTRISLPGRYLLLLTGSESVGVSRKIESGHERERLRRIVEKFRPFDHGIIVRTEAEGASEAELSGDLNFLWERLQHIRRKAAEANAPALLHREIGLLGRLVRDRLVRDRLNRRIESVVVDAPHEYHTLRELAGIIAPSLVERIHLHSGPVPLFDQFGIEADVRLAGERVVPLAHGGYLVIDEAEALTAIDVNTGKYVGKSRLADTILKTNLEAVEEAARQLRLRNIGGVIVIDFIDMERTRDRSQVMNTLESALKADRARTRIVQLSPLGLVEMTRRREGDSLRRLLHRPCPCCQGDGSIQTPTTTALEARRLARRLAVSLPSAQAPDALPTKAIQVTLHPETAMVFLGTNGECARALEEATGVQVFIRADFSAHQETVHCVSGDAPTFAGDTNDLQPGARLHLTAAALPRAEAPHFAVVQGTIVLLEHSDDGPPGSSSHGAPPSVIELVNTETRRWYVSARVLAWGKAEK